MTVKVIGVCLMLAYLFLQVLGQDLPTKEEFAAFKGVDPTKDCCDIKKLSEFCNKVGKDNGITDGKKPLLKGYPNCVDGRIILGKKGGGTDSTTAKLVNCAWDSNNFYILGKGKAANHVMNYDCGDDGSCVPYNDVKY